MPSPFLIVDGYNLMHAAGLARASYGPGDLGRQRMELLYELKRRLTPEERNRCTVVFDAIDAPKNPSTRFRHEGMLILFAEPGHEADELIELLIVQHSAPRRLTVVSSDHRLQTAVRKRRGTAVDSEDFWKRPLTSDRQIQGPQNKFSKGSKDTSAEVNFWMEEFAAIHPESIQADLEAQADEKKSDWDRHIKDLQERLQNPNGLDEWLDHS